MTRRLLLLCHAAAVAAGVYCGDYAVVRANLIIGAAVWRLNRTTATDCWRR